MKHSPEYRPETPYIYPLFKVHKLNQEQLINKVTPPNRMVNAAKHGPLYRMEKWMSPFLTSSSQIYCKSEYIKDTPQQIPKQIPRQIPKQIKNSIYLQ